MICCCCCCIFFFFLKLNSDTGQACAAVLLNPNTFAGLVGKVRKTISRRRKEGRVEKKSARGGPRAQTLDLPRARQGSPAACQGGCLDKQAFPCL